MRIAKPLNALRVESVRAPTNANTNCNERIKPILTEQIYGYCSRGVKAALLVIAIAILAVSTTSSEHGASDSSLNHVNPTQQRAVSAHHNGLNGDRELKSNEDIPEQSELRKQFPVRIQPLLENYCIRCHDQDTQSNVRLDTINPEIRPDNIDTWTRVKNMLDVGSMPPKDKKRPTAEELDLLLAWVGGSLKRYEADHRETGGDTLIRRINNRAYANMMKTLLDVPAQGIEDFPSDGAVRGYDTVGAGLYTTTHMYELYMKCAQETLNAAIPDSDFPPKVAQYKHESKDGPAYVFNFVRNNIESGIRDLRDNPQKFQVDNELSTINVSIEGALKSVRGFPTPTKSDVNLNLVGEVVAAHYGQKTLRDVAALGIQWANDPQCAAEVMSALIMQLQKLSLLEQHISEFQPVSVPGGTGVTGHTVKLSALRPGYYMISARLCLMNPEYPMPVQFIAGDQVVRTFMLYDPPTVPGTYETKVFLDSRIKSVSFYSTFPASLTQEAFFPVKHILYHLAALYGGKPQDFSLFGGGIHFGAPLSSTATTPEAEKMTPPPAGILCSGFSVRGPVYDTWPPPATTRIFTRGVKAAPTREYAEEILKSFMKRAYVVGDCSADMIQPYADMIMSHYESEKNFVEAVKFGLAAVLSSPQFLYLYEEPRVDASRRKPLGAFELARRLAYVLWSDLPDDALLAAAANGTLLKEQELIAQTRRMLKDQRSRAFREAFSTQWLKIDKLEGIEFSSELFPVYDKVLLASAKEESVAFFSEILDDKNLSILNFIDSDFAMLNGRLALHYGIPGITGNEFRRVQLPPGTHRGGLLTQASVLMATSNGMVGSLVRRGAFVMDRLLGVSPGTPPPNVPALDKTKVANDDGTPLTPRERMSMHRENISCARCHQKIDPLGVGLENFNALGSWNAKLSVLLREPDKKTHSMWVEREADVHGEMLDGTPYNGSDELKQRLLEQKDKFVRCLTENLLIYTLGRDLELSDRAVLDGICAKVAADKYALSTLIEQIIASDLFRNK